MVCARRIDRGEAADPIARAALARLRLLAVRIRHDVGGTISADRILDAVKTNPAPYRLVHFIVLAFFINRFLPREWPGLGWPILRPLITCGQQSLEVFCAGVFLAVAAHVVLVEIADAIWMQVVVSVVGIALLTAVAYYRSWSKKVDKPKAPSRVMRG